MLGGFILVGLSIFAGLASYQQAKKMQEKMDQANRGVEANIESNIKAIPVVYGERRVGGVRVFIDTSKDRTNQYLYMAIVMAEGEVEDITDIHIDDIPITDEKFSTNQLNGNVQYEVFTGTPNQPVSQLLKEGTAYSSSPDITNPEVAQYYADNDPSGNYPWADDHRLRGVAYIAMKFKWDENAYSGVPNITANVKGKKVYDPRTQTTAWSDNPALCIRDYLTNSVYGKGLDISAINDALFIQAANDIDSFSVIPYQDADAIQLFTLNMVIDTDKKIIENLNEMLLSCRGFLPYSNGSYGLRIDQATNHIIDIGPDYIIGGISITGTKKEDKFNQVKVNFFNKDKEYKEDTAVFPDTDSTIYQTYLTEDGGEVLVDDVDIQGINNYYTAREMAKLFLLRSRLSTAIAFTATSEAMVLEVGDTFRITHPTAGWNNKKFQVQEVGLNFDGTVELQAVEYSADIYTYNEATKETPFIPTSLPDPNKLEPVTNLLASTGTYINKDGSTVSFIDITYDEPNDALIDSYEITASYDGKDEIVKTASTFHRLITKDSTSYDISVRAVNYYGAKSTPVTTSSNSVNDTTAPGDITPVNVADGLKQIGVYWTNPTDDDFSHVLLKVSSTATEPASPVLTVSGSSYIHKVNDYNQTRYYWGAPVDVSGNIGNYTYIGSGSTNNVTIVTDEVQADNITTSADAFTSADVSLSNTYVSLQSATITVDPISKDNVNASFSVNAPSACAVVFKLTKNYTFGSPPTPVSITLYESRPNTIGSGGSQFNYNLIDVQSGLSQAVTYKLEAKITTTLTGVVARDRSLSAVDIKR